MELTNEQKARIFAMYANAPFLLCYNLEGKPVINPYGIGYKEIDSIQSDLENKRDLLILRPIDRLTDEEAIEVARMSYYGKEVDHYDEIHTTNKICKAGRRVDLLGERFFSIWFTKHGATVAFLNIYYSGELELQVVYDGKFKINSVKKTSEINQYLTSIFIAVPLFIAPNHPLNGQTAIDIGVAIQSPIKQA